MLGVVERGGGARFALEAIQCLRIECQVVGQQFQNYVAAQIDVLGLIDHAHAAAAQLRQHAVMRKYLEAANSEVEKNLIGRWAEAPRR